MTKLKEPNYLNLLDMRKVSFLPDHFEQVHLPFRYNVARSIEKWITDNLKGRFYVDHGVHLKDNTIDNGLHIGFEDTKEMSYFMLACPHLKYK